MKIFVCEHTRSRCSVLLLGAFFAAAALSTHVPEAQALPNLTITKEFPGPVGKKDDPDPVTVGHTLTYQMLVTNISLSDIATGVVLTDTLPPSVSFVSASCSTGTCPHAAGVVTWQVGDMPAGRTNTLTIQVTPNTPGVITNSASVAANEQDADSSDNSVSEDTTVVQPDLTINKDFPGPVGKQDDPDPVMAGSTLTYTMWVTNLGPGNATGEVLTDTLPPSVTFVSVDCASGTCGHAAGVVTWQIADQIPGRSDSIIIQVTPNEPGVITNTASVTSNEPDADPSNNAVSEDTTVFVPAPVLSQGGFLVAIALLLSIGGVAILRRGKLP